jgi:hypothetical protein
MNERELCTNVHQKPLFIINEQRRTVYAINQRDQGANGLNRLHMLQRPSTYYIG